MSQTTSINNTITELTARLERIAKRNEDLFSYKIEISPIFKTNPYRFVCQEVTDGHEILVGVGDTIDSAIKDAASSLEESLNEWEYDIVD